MVAVIVVLEERDWRLPREWSAGGQRRDTAGFLVGAGRIDRPMTNKGDFERGKGLVFPPGLTGAVTVAKRLSGNEVLSRCN
jgi:hypothetical protein